MLKLVNLLLLTASTIVLCYYSPRNIRLRTVQSRVYSSVFNRFQEAFRPKQKKKYMSESEKLVEYVDYKPWRATKVKHLNIHYKPWKDSWQERYRVENEDTIYLYSIDESRTLLSSTRVDDAWMWPWMWSKHKAERLAWIYKLFIEDVDSVTVQEHMEMDNFFSEFDMPTRWGLVRLKELDVLNVAALWLAFWTDFNGVKPTDLGLRPDGTVRTCPVQFHNCLSSSNSPLDTDHYAPPLRWDRAKSPDQVMVFSMFTNPMSSMFDHF